MLYRYAVKIAGIRTDERAELGRFTDSAKINAYAITAMRWAVGSGLMKGYPGQYAAAERHTDARRGRNASCLAGCEDLMIPARGLRPPLRIPCCNSQQKGQNL